MVLNMSGLHLEAAKILEKVLKSSKEKKIPSLRSLIYSNTNIANIKGLYKLVCETLKYKDVLQQIIDMSEILKRERRVSCFFLKNKYISM
jgi:putative methyltransferase